MDSKTYVLTHDFGYCREPELEELNKIILRNFEDLKFYIENIISDDFEAKLDNNILLFDDGSKVKVMIEKV